MLRLVSFIGFVVALSIFIFNLEYKGEGMLKFLTSLRNKNKSATKGTVEAAKVGVIVLLILKAFDIEVPDSDIATISASVGILSGIVRGLRSRWKKR